MKITVLLQTLCLLLFASVILKAQPQPVLEPFLSGFTRPVKITHAYDARLFVAEIGGKIKVIKNGAVNGTPFLDISSKINNPDWAGIFSIVFHPNYQSNGYFYVMYIVKGKTEINISRFQRSGNIDSDIAGSAETILLTIPYTDVDGGHRGGDMAFGKDNHLYISTGDNGPGSRGVMGDPEMNAQNDNVLFGKIIRLDVDSPNPANDILQKIWAKGLRNPWRFSFDRSTGDFWYGDNGQDGWEEVNFLAYNDVTTPRNFGWDYMEGNAVYRNCNCNITTSFAAPRYVYPGYNNNDGNSASVMGGYVYRGSKYRSLTGSYIFGDYISYKIGMITPGGFSGFLSNVTYNSMVSFGEDNQGELYVVSFLDGTIARITGPDVPLPVTLEYFKSKADGCTVALEWRTSAETNFSHFEVEHSQDGQTFQTVKTLPASGASQIYRYIDEKPFNEQNLYRLKMIDNDASFTFSRIQSAQANCQTTEIAIFPNPTMSHVSVKGVKSGHTIQVYNVYGKLILSRKAASSEPFELNMKNQPDGIYSVTIESENSVIAQLKLIKQ